MSTALADRMAERLRAHLVPGSTLAISPLPALSDVHTAAWGLTA